MRDVPDHRALGMKGVPYSSYCRVCWHPIYTLWIGPEDHGGKCMHGKTLSTDCEEARNRDAFSAEIAKLRALGLLKTPNEQLQPSERSAAK